MNTAVIENMSFQDKLKKRIQDSIGDLMTDEDLSKLVNAAMQDAFFQDKVTRNNYGQETYTPPPLHAIIKELLKDKVETCAKEYIESHSEEVAKIVKEYLDTNIASAFMRSINNMFQNDLYNFQNNIMNRLQSLR